MPGLVRRHSSHWHEEVPGARWFRADLHVHTLDDHPSPHLKCPDAVSGKPEDPETQTLYARALLRSAVANGIQVLGLTPHVVRSGAGEETCATWRIVEVWNQEDDDDGEPFRNKIYAVFPGFEPNLQDGKQGLHLIFLFDPEVGRADYCKAFSLVTGGRAQWEGKSLSIAVNSAKEAFAALRAFHEPILEKWNYLCLAPHAFSDHGLMNDMRGQLRQYHVAHRQVRGLGLSDRQLPGEAKERLKQFGLAGYGHALFHASDAKCVEEIGQRFVMLKLARPTIEALRQAMLGHDSRMRNPYIRGAGGDLTVSDHLPECMPLNRPWLRSVSIEGGTSFFAGTDRATGQPTRRTLHFSPDLTCVIGGRMSGKSALLDGLRVHFGHDLPKERGKSHELRADVKDRADLRFLSGNPTVCYDVPGPIAQTEPLGERWPARMFTQRELMQIVEDQDMRRDIVFRLVPPEIPGILERRHRIEGLDLRLSEMASSLDGIWQMKQGLELEFESTRRARQALEAFREAGIDYLVAAQADQSILGGLRSNIEGLSGKLLDGEELAKALAPPALSDPAVRKALDSDPTGRSFGRLADRFVATVRYQARLLRHMLNVIVAATAMASDRVRTSTAEVQDKLVRAGRDAEDLNRFNALRGAASQYEEKRMAVADAQKAYDVASESFNRTWQERERLVSEQRRAMAKISGAVRARSQERIRIRCIENKEHKDLEWWISELRKGGVTRWWNTIKDAGPPHLCPAELNRALSTDRLNAIGMSADVEATFRSVMTEPRTFQLLSLRSEDAYKIELKQGDDYRDIQRLSGGAQVAVLLELLLETEDDAPLVIDQPEDEMDKDFLVEYLLPTLRRLKGRRQIIFATHDANVVVNGDADQVIFLRAEFNKCTEDRQGAIDDPGIKDCILLTVDGGRAAFEARRAKYGY